MPDPRSTDGELLCPALYPAERVESLKRELLRDYPAQFQQQPTTETGAHFHRAWLPVKGCAAGRLTGRTLSLLGSRLHETNTRHRSGLDGRRARLTLA